MVPRSKSRSSLGETADGGLYEIFQREFGAPGTARFEKARKAFLVSEAGYAIASYILQCKDRHNGNILIDSEGHLIHIDFGFILEISPGGNMRFERADFKLSHEMTQLLDPGGRADVCVARLYCFSLISDTPVLTSDDHADALHGSQPICQVVEVLHIAVLLECICIVLAS